MLSCVVRVRARFCRSAQPQAQPSQGVRHLPQWCPLVLPAPSSSSDCVQVPFDANTVPARRRRLHILDTLLRHPRVDTAALDARGQNFLFGMADWGLVVWDYDTARLLLDSAAELGVDVMPHSAPARPPA